jgi:hypothetical protein
MPRSIIIYASRECLVALRAKFVDTVDSSGTPPYTISHGQKLQEPEKVRVRITELQGTIVAPILEEIAKEYDISVASGADREVRAISYEDLLENASPVDTNLTLQFMSPVIVDIGAGSLTPFPVLTSVFQRYSEVWNLFSAVRLSFPEEVVRSLKVTQFALSCRSTRFGTGAQGWVTIDLGKGKTEDEIRLFNTLTDFSFFAGTGLYVHEGLGQTCRMERRNQRTVRPLGSQDPS